MKECEIELKEGKSANISEKTKKEQMIPVLVIRTRPIYNPYISKLVRL